MRHHLPLVHLHGIVEGKYEADYPVFIVGDSPEALTFTVSVDERRFASLGNVLDDPVERDIRRRYVTRTVVPGAPAVITINSRLDLFASESLEQAAHLTPSPGGLFVDLAPQT